MGANIAPNYMNQIVKGNSDLTDEQQQKIITAAGAESGNNMRTYASYASELPDITAKAKQRRDIIQAQFELLQGDVASRLQKTTAQSYIGSSGVQSAANRFTSVGGLPQWAAQR